MIQFECFFEKPIASYLIYYFLFSTYPITYCIIINLSLFWLFMQYCKFM